MIGRLAKSLPSQGAPWPAGVGLVERLTGLLGLGSTLCLGVGGTLLMAGVGSGALELMVAGALLGGLGVTVLIALDAVEGLALVILSLPLPALYASGDVRLAFAAPVTALVLLGWWLSAAPSRTSLHLERLPRRSVLLLVGWYMAAGLLSGALLTAAREVLNLVVMILLLLAAVDRTARAPHRRELVVGLLVGVAAVCGVAAVLESVGVLPAEFVGRGGSRLNRAALGFGQPNALGLFLAVLLPLAAYTARRGARRRGWGMVALAWIVLGLVATFSRGSWLAVLGGVGVFLLVGEIGRVARVWILGLVAALIVDVLTGGAIRQTVALTIGDWVIEQRAALMLAGVLMFLDHPLVGVGPGGYAEQLPLYAGQIPWLTDLLSTPHNAYVHMAAETGLVGLVSYLLFLGALVGIAARGVRETEGADERERSFRRALLWCMGVVVTTGFVGWPLSHGAGQAVVLVMALTCTEPMTGHESSGIEPAP